MAEPGMDLSTSVGKLFEEQDGDVLREGLRVLAQALMDTEVTALVGAERHERTEERPSEVQIPMIQSPGERLSSGQSITS